MRAAYASSSDLQEVESLHYAHSNTILHQLPMSGILCLRDHPRIIIASHDPHHICIHRIVILSEVKDVGMVDTVPETSLDPRPPKTERRKARRPGIEASQKLDTRMHCKVGLRACNTMSRDSTQCLLVIRESVDSLCRDGADTPMAPYTGKAFTRTNVEHVEPF